MIQVLNEKDCCGCGACASVCPKRCIKMEKATLGCVIPKVELNDCINCGACEKVCPIKTDSLLNSEFNQTAFAAYAKDNEIRKNGSSGGMFQIFANKVFSLGGIVYGAAFDDLLNLKCTSAQNSDELQHLLKSKYLQSDMGGQFAEIKNVLDAGRQVLYVSTPCQVAALKCFLKKEYDNLITVDFFCHGVPSQAFFNECIEYDEKNKYNGKVIKYTFREKKKNGSTPHYYSCDYITKNKRVAHRSGYYFESTFYAAFQKYICLRESCYNCKFYGRERNSDITIGDFHEIDKYLKGINRFDGVSTVVINSNKGKKLFELCADNIIAYSVSLERLINDKVCFSACTAKPAERDEFILEYSQHGVDGIYKKYLQPRFYIKNKIYYGLPKFIRNILKK